MGARIEEHPILGKQEKGRLVTFYFDGKELTGYEGEPIAAALKAQGVMIHRYTKKEHKPRGIFCAIGRCTDCVMVVNGKPLHSLYIFLSHRIFLLAYALSLYICVS